MRKFLFVALFVCANYFVNGQNLNVEGIAPKLYIEHTVAPKENFYSVGRLYNQSPKSIAAFNNLSMERGLNIGQHLKVPLDDMNFENGEITNPGETLIPLTHIVKPGETIFKLASNNQVEPELIKKWNNLSDNIAPGRALIVGHLRVKNDQENVNALKAAAQPTSSIPPAPARRETNVVKEPVAMVGSQPQFTPAAEKPVQKVEQPAAAKPETPATVATTPQLAPPATAPAANANTTANTTVPVVAKSYGSIDLGSTAEGAFASNFPNAPKNSAKNLNGEAGTFKSTSGWQDKKYYVLINDIIPGTIVKISANDNKFVFAKVLGSMPEMKENNGLLLRISNSAASHLGIIDPKFPVQISYYQ